MLTQTRRLRGPAVLPVVGVNLVLAGALGLRPRAGLLVVALCLLVPAANSVLRRPQRGVLALVALAPFNGLLLIIPHPAIANGWKEALVLATLAATFFCPREARATDKGVRPSRRSTGWFPALIGLLMAAFVAAGSGDPLHAVLGFKITFFYALAGWTVWRCPLGERERDRLVSILMITGIIQAIVAVLQQAVGAARLNALGFQYNTTIRFAGGFLRSFGTFIQPFPLGFYLMAVVLICTPVALSDTSRRRNVLFLLMLPLLGLGIATTVVRGAILGLGVGVAYLGGHRYRILLLAFPLGLAAILLLPQDVSNAALSSKSSQQRATGWRKNFNVITAHPVGAGPGTSSAAAEKVASLQHSQAQTYQPDNYFYKIAYEDGMLGLWFFCLLLVAAFLAARRASHCGAGPPVAFAAGVSAFFIAAAGASLVSSFFEIFPMDVLFCVLLVCVATLPVDLSENDSAAGVSLAGLDPRYGRF